MFQNYIVKKIEASRERFDKLFFCYAYLLHLLLFWNSGSKNITSGQNALFMICSQKLRVDLYVFKLYLRHVSNRMPHCLLMKQRLLLFNRLKSDVLTNNWGFNLNRIAN